MSHFGFLWSYLDDDGDDEGVEDFAIVPVLGETTRGGRLLEDTRVVDDQPANAQDGADVPLELALTLKTRRFVVERLIVRLGIEGIALELGDTATTELAHRLRPLVGLVFVVADQEFMLGPGGERVVRGLPGHSHISDITVKLNLSFPEELILANC